MAIKVLESKVLGKLSYDAEYEWYATEYKDGERTFEIQIIPEDPDELNDFELTTLLHKIERLMESKYYEAVLIDMEETLIRLKNESWLKDDEPEITTDEFRRRISIDKIVFYDDATSEIDCDDDDIFDGRYLTISVNESGVFEEVTIFE